MTLDRRTKARELTMQALCQLDVQGADAVGMLHTFFREYADGDDRVMELAKKWTHGTWEMMQTCDDLISQAAVRWKLSRLSHVDRAILRMSVYQLRYCEDVPRKVVINEAIEIAKKYSTEQSPRFVNGVLDAVLKSFQSEPVETSSAEEQTS